MINATERRRRSRAKRVIESIKTAELSFTCCENDRLDALVGGKVFHIHGGEVVT